MSDASAKMLRGCYEETASVEFQLYRAATLYASTVYAVAMCLSMCVYVCLSVTRRYYIKTARHKRRSRKQRHTIAHEL